MHLEFAWILNLVYWRNSDRLETLDGRNSREKPLHITRGKFNPWLSRATSFFVTLRGKASMSSTSSIFWKPSHKNKTLSNTEHWTQHRWEIHFHTQNSMWATLDKLGTTCTIERSSTPYTLHNRNWVVLLSPPVAFTFIFILLDCQPVSVVLHGHLARRSATVPNRKQHV
jgi:hypothetical protein